MKIYRCILAGAVVSLGATLGPMVLAQAPVVDAYQSDTANKVYQDKSFEKQQVDSQSSAILLERMEAMQLEIQKLRGQLEVQAHDLKLLNEQQKAFYSDLDQRVTKGEQISSELADKTEPQIPAVTAAKTEDNAPVAAVTLPKDADGAYAMAYTYVKEKDYAKAVVAMQAFLAAHADSAYASNAYYWLGELYLLQGEVAKAVKQFTTVITQYPQSPKVAGAMLKRAFAYYEDHQWSRARTELEQVKQKYPDSSVARLAVLRLENMDKQGL